MSVAQWTFLGVYHEAFQGKAGQGGERRGKTGPDGEGGARTGEDGAILLVILIY